MTYRTVKLLREQDLHFNFVLVADDALTGPDKVAVRFGRLYLKHYGHLTLVDQAHA